MKTTITLFVGTGLLAFFVSCSTPTSSSSTPEPATETQPFTVPTYTAPKPTYTAPKPVSIPLIPKIPSGG